uniref:Uncharacterized protein n=1 Tax=Brugia timori TaxID=42155 RepID=A0A0R3QXW6_9BILA
LMSKQSENTPIHITKKNESCLINFFDESSTCFNVFQSKMYSENS